MKTDYQKFADLLWSVGQLYDTGDDDTGMWIIVNNTIITFTASGGYIDLRADI